MTLLLNPGMARRLASLFYESLVVFGILLAGFIFPQAVLHGFGMIAEGRWLWLHVVVLLMTYFVWFWSNGGQTLAMKSWRLRIVNQDGAPLRPMQAVLRYLAAWPSIGLLGAGLLWALVDREHLYLHDRIAGSRIIYEPAQAGPTTESKPKKN